MKAKLIHIFCILLVLTMVLGCQKPPTEEMENAREAVFRAENDNNAAAYAGSTLSRARTALQLMQDEAENKRYDSAKTHAFEAIMFADRAISEGKQGAERAKDEAAVLVSGLRPEIVETERNVNGARYSQLPLDYNSLERDIVNAHEAADRAEESHAEGKHQNAIDIAANVRSDLSAINGKVAGAATTRKK